MRKKKNSKQAETSLVYFSIAAATLSLLAITPKTVKADETVPITSATQTVAGKNSVNNTVASPKSSTNDQPKVNTPEAPQSQDLTPNPSLDTFKWGNLDVTYSNHVVTVPGGSVTQPGSMAYINGINKDDIQEVKFTGQLKVNSAAEMFRGLPNLTKITGLKNLDTSDTIDMRYMFANCKNLTSIDGIGDLQTPKVTNMLYMFADCGKLTDLDLSGFDTTNTQYVEGMFQGCENLQSIKFSPKFTIANVNSMKFMFSGCSNLTALDLSKFNTSNVTNMIRVFEDCSSLTKLDLSSFDTSKVNDMIGMFTDCSNLKELDLSSFVIDPGIDKGYMLQGLAKLNTLKLGKSTHINESYLDTPGTWVNVGNGTEDAPEANQKLSSNVLAAQGIGDTYIRLGAPIKAFYLDIDGKSIADETTLNGKIGNSYKLTPKIIPGYVIKEIPSNATGFFTDQPQSVKFIYSAVPVSVSSIPAASTPVKAANIIVHYQDERGNKLAPDMVLQGNAGDGYITSPVEIAGYTLKTRPDNATGFYSDQNQEVTYIYTKNATGLNPIIRTVFHNSYVYDESGIRKTREYFAGETVKTYSTKLIQGKKYYDLGNNDFVKAVNITGVNRKLKHNAYIYTKKANKKVKRLDRKGLKKHTKLKTYGGTVKMHKKLYYIVGKNCYIKKANF